jgi:hypothetical protein
MQIAIGIIGLVLIGVGTCACYVGPVASLRFVARHCLLQARGLEARERAIQAERAAVWEVV